MNLDLPFKLAMQDEEIAKSLGKLITKQEVIAVQGLQTDYLRKIAEIKADKVYEITLHDGERAILHLEVQGKQSHRDMALRMFDYITRIISQSGNLAQRLYSVVIYVGQGAGAHDDGVWDFGNPVIGSFSYLPLKLWQLDANELLNADDPNLLAFLPQTKLEHPKAQLNQAMERIAKLEDKDHVAYLLYTMATLSKEKGLQQMVDLFISKQEMLEAPDFIRDAYLKAHNDGIQKGLTEGIEKGIEEGIQKGLTEGMQKGLTEGITQGHQQGMAEGITQGVTKGITQGKIDSVLQLLHLRFADIAHFENKALHAIFSTMNNEQLTQAFAQAVKAQSLDEMKEWLASLDEPQTSNTSSGISPDTSSSTS